MSQNEIAAAYIRISTQEQKEDNSHIQQRDRIAKWAEENGLDPGDWQQFHTRNENRDIIDWESINQQVTGDIHWFEDIAISGKAKERDGYDAMMGDFEAYDYIVVRELSRLGRDVAQILNDVHTIGESDEVEFVSVTEPMLDTTSAHGKLMVNLIASMNDFYAEMRREQAQMMVERRREKGLPIGRPRKLNEAQLQDVVDWREKGLSYSAIAALVGEVHGVEVNQSTIYRYCDEFEVEQGVADD